MFRAHFIFLKEQKFNLSAKDLPLGLGSPRKTPYSWYRCALEAVWQSPHLRPLSLCWITNWQGIQESIWALSIVTGVTRHCAGAHTQSNTLGVSQTTLVFYLSYRMPHADGWRAQPGGFKTPKRTWMSSIYCQLKSIPSCTLTNRSFQLFE